MRNLSIITLLLALILPCMSTAQPKKVIKIGVKGGVNMSRFIEKGLDNNFLFSYAAGISVKQNLVERIALSHSLLYSKQGNILYFNNPGIYNRVRTRYNYIIISNSVVYDLKKYPISLIAGLQTGYLARNRVDFLPSNGSISGKLPIKKIDLGYSIGIGHEFSKRLFLEVRYYQSFNSVLKEFESINPISGSLIRVVPDDRLNQTINGSLKYCFN